MGAEATDIVAQASPLDLGSETFPRNGASFTEFFGQKGLLFRRADGFECFVDSSYADFIADCLSRCHARFA
jgi:sarcosine oxidase gamma subunit